MRGTIGVVIVSFNSAHVIEDLLDSLPAAIGDLSAEVVVVDNGSTDGSVNLLTTRTDCTLVEATNLGYSAGFNRGVKAVGDVDAYLLLNPDVRLQPGSVPVLYKTLELPRTGVVAPRIVDADGHLQPSMRREPTLLRALGLGATGKPALSEYVSDPASYDRSQPVDWALGAVLLISSDCLTNMGPWDESFFLYSEETDFCLRARDHGWVTRFVAEAEAVHVGAQSGQSPRIHVMQIINRVRLYRRRHRVGPTVVYYVLSLASEASWVIRGHRQSISAIKALLWPRCRPAELNCSDRLIPS